MNCFITYTFRLTAFLQQLDIAVLNVILEGEKLGEDPKAVRE